MRYRTWGVVCAIAAAASLGIVHFTPLPEKSAPKVQKCGENAGWIEAPPGYIACTLKNGQVINLRSVK